MARWRPRRRARGSGGARTLPVVAALGIGIVVGVGAGLASGQGHPLPPGRNVELVVGRCIICHGLETTAQQRQDWQGWAEIVDRMITYGAPIPPEDRTLILDYLVTYLGR
jgi:hypothetical protein